MYEVGVVEHFEAAHRLRGNFGPATRTHGHTYRVELVAAGDRLQEDGTLCDIGELRQALRAVLVEFHFQDLDELPEFRGRNSTAEVVAEHVLERVLQGIAGARLALMRVSVWESESAFASCERRLADH
jgi:6-pyruvoyltetrahydropterin/6-carboxytetrahydropterin synthase